MPELSVNELTLGKLRDIWNAIRLPLYYATDEMVERGQVFLCKEPEFLVCHSDSLGGLQKEISHRRLVPLRDRPPGQFSIIEEGDMAWRF